jgi:hypothetical protein
MPPDERPRLTTVLPSRAKAHGLPGPGGGGNAARLVRPLGRGGANLPALSQRA